MLIERKEYLDTLECLRDKQIIKVITGVRRCGKSTLLDLFANRLIDNGISSDRIIQFNFERGELADVLTEKDLYQKVTAQLVSKGKHYILLDEVQMVENFEKAVDALFVRADCDVYITGSNANLLSGELATLLSGRYMEVSMLPLSFREFAQAQPDPASLEQLYARYLRVSSFPFALQLERPQDIDRYLQDLYNTILVKDVLARRNFTSVNGLKSISRFLFDNIGNLCSYKSIADALTAAGTKTSNHTVEQYVEALTQSYIFYEAVVGNLKGKQLLNAGRKHYAVDIGLRCALLGTGPRDRGHILENVVYLELLRRGYVIKVGRVGMREVDFVVNAPDQTAYYQVAYSLADADGSALRRELAPLEAIPDHHPKYILSMDWDMPASFNGIRHINVLNWLMRAEKM